MTVAYVHTYIDTESMLTAFGARGLPHLVLSIVPLAVHDERCSSVSEAWGWSNYANIAIRTCIKEASNKLIVSVDIGGTCVSERLENQPAGGRVYSFQLSDAVVTRFSTWGLEAIKCVASASYPSADRYYCCHHRKCRFRTYYFTGTSDSVGLFEIWGAGTHLCTNTSNQMPTPLTEHIKVDRSLWLFNVYEWSAVKRYI